RHRPRLSPEPASASSPTGAGDATPLLLLVFENPASTPATPSSTMKAAAYFPLETQETREAVEAPAKPDVSIVIPLKNEAENVAQLCRELRMMMDRERASYEVLIINDGSD